jgi:uncharacterized protein YbjT (DUF2867 family)
MSKPLILVSGATSMAGSHPVPGLADREVGVRALVRDPQRTQSPGSGFNVTIRGRSQQA